ncbi:hypothetical protein HYQ45_013820 [Verticillium longisporum]|nr:hypothetical protein HYQ45_013820 [Verticillium longisporum]
MVKVAWLLTRWSARSRVGVSARTKWLESRPVPVPPCPPKAPLHQRPQPCHFIDLPKSRWRGNSPLILSLCPPRDYSTTSAILGIPRLASLRLTASPSYTRTSSPQKPRLKLAYSLSNESRSSPSARPATAILHKTANMTKPNDTIAIIVIVLFVVLALVAFGIYRLVHQARRSMSVTSGSSGSSSELAD